MFSIPTAVASRAGWLLLALGSATLMLLPARAQDEPSPNPKHYVTGVVFEKETHKPIADARVNFFVDSEQDPAKREISGTTDSDGRYRIEVPLGSFRLAFPRLKPGYWLEPDANLKPLATSLFEPIVTHDIAAKRGLAWPVQVEVEGGIPDDAKLMISVIEIEDDAARKSWLNRESVSFKKSLNQSISPLGAIGTGAFTQCGETGKLVVSLLGRGPVENIMTEFVVEPGFDLTKIKSIAPVAGTDKVTMTDDGGAKATIGKAVVTVHEGLPLLTFHLARRSPLSVQGFVGQIVDAAGDPIEGVRVGSAIGSSAGGSSVTDDVAETDQDGQFSLNLTMPESKKNMHLMLVITKDGYAGFDSRKIDLPTTSAAVIDVGQFTLQAGQSLPIRVVDEHDKPLAGAVVEPGSEYAQRRQTIRTNAQGRGVLRNLPAGVVFVRANYGPLTYQSKIVVDDESADGEETTLQLRELNQQRAQATAFPDPPPVGAAAPEWSIVGWTDGQTRKLSDYRGKVVVLDFWGIWCSACMNGLPAAKNLEAKYAGRSDVVFLGMHSAGSDMSQVKKLQRLKEWKLVAGLDQGSDVVEGATARAYGVHLWPTTVIIDRDGKIAYNTNLNLEKWNAVTVFQEHTRIAKAMKLPPVKPGASVEDRQARMHAMKVFSDSELIDRVLERK
jgi:thiol-disulfide isomerase/thioredoxin